MYPRYLYAITEAWMRRKQSYGLFDLKSWLPVETIWTNSNDKGGNIVVMKKVKIEQFYRFTCAKTFHRVFTTVGRDRITSRLIYYNKIFCTMLFSIDVHWNSSIKLTKLLVRCLNACSLKRVLRHVRMTCVNTVCDILKAHPQSHCYSTLIG